MNYYGNVNEISGSQSSAALIYTFSYTGMKTLRPVQIGDQLCLNFVNKEPLGNTAQINVGWRYVLKCMFYGDKNKLITNS